jgi:uncharacterized protein YgiM (DUF1202 family)
MARVISERANLRETPSSTGNIEQEVAEGTLVKVLDEQGPWYIVRVGERVGWLHGNTLQFLNRGRSVDNVSWRRIPITDDLPSMPSNSDSRGNREVRAPSTGRTYIRGPRGGCYYYGGTGRKVYVDRNLCN